MIRSIEDADRPTKRGKKVDQKKEGPSTKATTPKKRKQDKAAPSQPKKKKIKKVVKKPIISSTSDFDYVPSGHQPIVPPTESDTGSESSDDESSVRGGTPPRSPTP